MVRDKIYWGLTFRDENNRGQKFRDETSCLHLQYSHWEMCCKDTVVKKGHNKLRIGNMNQRYFFSLSRKYWVIFTVRYLLTVRLDPLTVLALNQNWRQ